MFSMLCLLFAAVLISWTPTVVDEPVACDFADASQPNSGVDLLDTVCILMYLVLIYGNQFVALYSTESSPYHG